MISSEAERCSRRSDDTTRSPEVDDVVAEADAAVVDAAVVDAAEVVVSCGFVVVFIESSLSVVDP